MEQRTWLALALALALSACSGGGGGSNNAGSSPSTPAPPGPTVTDSLTYSAQATASLSTPNEISAVTKHQLAIGGTTLNYTATAGHLSAMTLTSPTAEASFFYVAYTLDGANPATRPVTFFYNGGPGSATVWLHLGSFGPKRLVTNAPSTTTPDAVRIRRQHREPARRERPRVRGCHRHGILRGDRAQHEPHVLGHGRGCRGRSAIS